MRTVLALCLGLLFSATAYSQLELRPSQLSSSVAAGAEAPRPRRVARTPITDIGLAERIAFDMLNQKRAENGLAPLVWNDQIATLAREHSADMAEMKYFSHQDLDGRYVSARADVAGIKKWRAIGENIAYNKGFVDPIVGAVEAWMNSESHRHNLLNDNWRESAVGVAIASDGSYFFTQVFLKR